MADNRTMEELLQAPTEGYGEAIVISEINTDHFEIKTNLLQLVQAGPYHGFERENPHTHINNFKRITSTLKFRDVPNNLADQISTLVDIFAKKVITPAPVKSVEEECVTCGAAHAYYNCRNTDSNQLSVCVAMGTYNQVTPQNRASNYMAPPGFAPNQASNLGTLPRNTIPNPKAMLLKKLLEKLGDPDKFLIPCDFPEMDVCHALADLDASINLMPLSIWKKLSLPELTPTRMTLELADRSITRLKGVAKDVFVKRTAHALIDVYREEITLRVNDKSITFNLNQTTRYSSTYNDLLVNRIDIIDVAREEFAQEIIGFSNNSSGGNPTSTSEPILSDSSPSFTLFEGSDFILEEIVAYLKDESISLEINHADCDSEGDQGEVVKEKSSIEEPPKLELKDLPSHLEYAYLEGIDMLPVIIAKDLKGDEKEALLKVLKSHKRAIAWKITDVKGIDASIVYTDHSPVKYLLSNQDAKPMLIRWILLLQEFDIIIRDKKGTENLAADHLSRLENPHKDVFKNKNINENFPLETLGKISSGSTPWMLNITSGTIPTFFGYVRIKSFDGVCMAKKLLISSNLVMKDPPRAIMGIDFMGPFLSLRGNRYILMADDYFSKWVEAKALPTNDARVVVKFLKSLFARFETPRAIISDRVTHFCNDKFAKVMSKCGVTRRLATAYHPQTSGQVEVSNQGLKRILERTVGENRALWSKKLDDALWAFRATYKTPIRCTPYKLKLQLNELNELRDQAYENSLIYKEKTKKLHDSKIKNRILNVGDQVLLFNSRLKIFLRNLKTRWSGPFTITKVFPYGTVELSQPDGLNFKVNGHRVKHYFEGNVPQLVVSNLQTFPMDK
nr:reverse transcriptase domain-containing protein [Tanacetum cinerariifolium]